jgi:TolB-like protein
MVHAEAIAIGGAPQPPDAASVRAQFGRIQSSADFDVPDRARKFLGYVVEETLAGRADRIKAYSIALEVFGRDATFDAQSDPVVRIEAGRVRRALERYYLTAGRADPILITIPKGGYVPQFTLRAAPEPDVVDEPVSRPRLTTVDAVSPSPEIRKSLPRMWIGATAILTILLIAAVSTILIRQQGADTPAGSRTGLDVPRLLIEPFEDLTGDAQSKVITLGLREEILGQIAKFRDLIVVDAPPASAESRRESELPRYILAGSVRTEGNIVRLTARLRNAEDGSILWTQSYDADRQVQQLLEIQAEIAKDVTTALAQPYGAIFQADAVQVAQTPPNDWEAYTCTLAYYTYRVDLSPETYAFVRDCLERTVKRFPTYSTAWALLSIAYFDGFRFRYSVKPTPLPPIQQALDYARRAVELDPRNARAQQALMMSLHLNGEIPAALEVGRRAVEANPNDIELRGEYGVRLSLSGQWKDGLALISDTVQRSTGLEGYFEMLMSLSAYMLRDSDKAVMWIKKSDQQANPLYHFVAAAVYARAGLTEEAVKDRDWIVKNAQPLLQNARREVAIRIARPEDRAYLIEGFELAGLPVPPVSK